MTLNLQPKTRFPEFLQIPPRLLSPITGLYLHTPFCFHKCHYCDFYSIVEDESRQRPFVDRLIEEVELRSTQFTLRPQSVFVGGGTPTLLSPEHWERLLDALQALRTLDDVTEFTVEANPETVTNELMRVLAAGGVNRVSLGAQSFHPNLLKALERWHDPASVERAVSRVREAGITNINLDLIFAIPGQTMMQLDADLTAALAMQPTHVSYYNLTYEPNTALTKRLKMGQFDPLPEEVERQMYEHIMLRLNDAGFEHYEISAWARREERNDFRCRHNLCYWINDNWLAIGPSGASHVDGLRWKNEAHLGRYLSLRPEPPIMDVEQLDEQARTGEALMLGLRLRQGVSLHWLESRVPAHSLRHSTIWQLINAGMLERTPTHLRLTQRGIFVADEVFSQLL